MVQLLRASLRSSKPISISKRQGSTLHDPGIKGAIWISKVAFPPPAEAHELLDVLTSAVDALKEASEYYEKPTVVPVEAEWTGYRPKAKARQPRPDISEARHYEELMSDTTSDVTILHLHGGVYFLSDPYLYRSTTSKLARLTGGRCLSVRYRLAPQATFPAQLLDVLVAYLSLIFPPPGSFHAPIPTSMIVVAGDSAGGINRLPSPTPLKFHENTISLPLPMPAGIAIASPMVDLTHSLPSLASNMRYDYLPARDTPGLFSNYAEDDVWPTDPPRGDLLCDTSMLCHPLVSPVTATDWKGACPIWMGVGEEMLVDESKVLAARIAKQGAPVQFDMWEAMPNCFQLVLVMCGLKAYKSFYKRWERQWRRDD